VLASRNNQLALLEREVKGVRDLVTEGYAPLNRQMELERAMADISASTADVHANLTRAQSAILEVRQRAEALRSDYRKEVDTQLADVRRECNQPSVKASPKSLPAGSDAVGGHVVDSPSDGRRRQAGRS
jgi:protease secretion system membrane fusion protein